MEISRSADGLSSLAAEGGGSLLSVTLLPFALCEMSSPNKSTMGFPWAFELVEASAMLWWRTAILPLSTLDAFLALSRQASCTFALTAFSAAVSRWNSITSLCNAWCKPSQSWGSLSLLASASVVPAADICPPRLRSFSHRIFIFCIISSSLAYFFFNFARSDSRRSTFPMMHCLFVSGSTTLLSKSASSCRPSSINFCQLTASCILPGLS
mmetsp:Transcript_33868/g.81994  ORF Transcript_33868/g.81994 Transcript_33868/m.81994 type:complete len:211 (-) Transcript_33868:31-663(-)